MPNVFQADLVFNRTEWRKPEVHTAVLRDGENYSANSTTGNYYMMPEFSMQIRTALETEQEVEELVAKIPCSEQFRFIVIE